MQPRRSPSPAAPNFKPAQRPINVMVVDDSLTVRTVFSRMITSDPALELAATASTAEDAIEKVAEQAIDVVLLDLEMPGMGGIKALPLLLDARKGVQVLVVSSLTEAGAEHTLRALAMGAADTMLKPRPGGFDEAYRLSLLKKIQALGEFLEPEELEQTSIGQNADFSIAATKSLGFKRPELIAFGASTGGIHALTRVLKALPKGFRLPIIITQHLPSSFVPIFARQIEVASGRKTVVGSPGTPVRRGEIMVAEGDGHLIFERVDDALVAKKSKAPAPSGCLPSVDPMLSSLAETLDGHALAVILSGMGRDGVVGAKELSDAGGRIFAQDPDSAAVWGMPGAVTKAGLTSACLPPEELSEAIATAAGALAWK